MRNLIGELGRVMSDGRLPMICCMVLFFMVRACVCVCVCLLCGVFGVCFENIYIYFYLYMYNKNGNGQSSFISSPLVSLKELR